jgi:hypothetical protein
MSLLEIIGAATLTVGIIGFLLWQLGILTIETSVEEDN